MRSQGSTQEQRSSCHAHRVAASGGRALGHGLARGFRFGRNLALVTQM